MLKGFKCLKCEFFVPFKAMGTKNRNHCPKCLWSVHVDDVSGDRSSKCRSLMEPIGKIYKEDGEEVLIHKCTKCGLVRKNRIAGDDDWGLVADLKALTNPC